MNPQQSLGKDFRTVEAAFNKTFNHKIKQRGQRHHSAALHSSGFKKPPVARLVVWKSSLLRVFSQKETNPKHGLTPGDAADTAAFIREGKAAFAGAGRRDRASLCSS